ncbi:hypothetical protein ONE63_006909 [Megalurothrips usitatus]|uniref:Spaetzle domain-containing protein n=1 Tax=Megalurothrips usitatus TaxID=439358 RepID=A0AAV7XXX1_9NEOP|nr:hypothetical protein ONE63_006909 [Megalurothrips usitatus]
MRPPPLPGRTPTTALTSTTPLDRGDHHGCSLFSDTVCESVERYPEDAILASIHADKHTVDALLADKSPPGARSGALLVHGRRQDDDYPSDSPQDLDGQDGGVDDTHLCPSVIKYARPQRARATSGQWKYIVNTAEHTQTLRLEKCSRVEEPCNYLSDKVRSHCAQVYNYHRLLTWDKELGLHMDIFKVPTCCSCQVIKSPFLTSNSLARRPGLGLPGSPFQHLQPVADFSHTQETVVVAESGRPVHPQYALKPFNQRDSASKASAAASSKPNWPFRKPATRRPPLQGHPQGVPQGHGHGPQYGLQTLEESPAPGEQLPQYPPLSPHNEYEYTPHRRAASVRNRTREPLLDDLAAEGTQRRPVPVILTPEGHPVRVPASVTATSKRPLPPVLPPRLETYRPRATTAAATATPTTAAPATSAAAPIIIPTTAPAPGAPSTPTPKRVNYSYHPIIDFFRPLEKQMTAAQEPRNARPPPSPPQPQALQQRQEEVAEQRTAPDDSPLPGPSWSAQQSDWSPITRTVTPKSR